MRGPEDLETRAEKLRVLGSSAEDGRPLTLEALPRHMERRALQVLVLDVAEEAKAVWRGLRAVPGAALERALDMGAWLRTMTHQMFV